MAAPRPPLPLRLLLGASLACAILPAGFAFHYARGWWDSRRGKDVQAQRFTMRGVTWFKPPFVRFVAKLKDAIPPDSRVLFEPIVEDVDSLSGSSRWHLFLNHYAYPIRFYARKPALASGTLVDYPRWVLYNNSLDRPEWSERRLIDSLAIDDRDIEYRLRVPLTDRFEPERCELHRREGGRWVRIELFDEGGSGGRGAGR